MDYTTLTDTELQEIFHAANEETSRRNLIAAALTREPILQTGYLVALGRADGEPYVQPSGAHDAYPKGWIAIHDGVLWKSKINYNVTKPGSDIQWWERVEEPETEPTPVPWTEQQWPKGSLVTHDGRVWLALQDVLAPNWAPGPALYAYWKDMGAV